VGGFAVAGFGDLFFEGFALLDEFFVGGHNFSL
jgi:hypothetical protein